MTQYAISPWELPAVPVAGSSDLFPVRRIFCVGRNYAEHAREMGGNPDKEPPFFFLKSADSIYPVVPPTVGQVAYPLRTADYHHEIELVVALARGGVRIAADRALDLVFGYATGLDMTRRDLQAQAKKTGRPWEFGKTFGQAAPIAPLHRASDIGHPSSGAIWLDVNGARRQSGNLNDLIWDVPNSIAFLSQYYELLPGDLIYTGTPAGVGPAVVGDQLHGHIDGLTDLRLTIRPGI